MIKTFSVGAAAKAAHITSETLRHYDRIGLVKPSIKDAATGYRYYTEQDLVRINTVLALQQMDLSLHKIKEALELDDLEQIIAFLKEAEKRADEKIFSLQNSKAKIQLAKASYENHLRGQGRIKDFAIRQFPKRVILLSDTLETPTLDTLWSYLSHFYDKLDPLQKDRFAFEDTAGIYTDKELVRLFAVCTRHGNIDGLKILPEGKYLCADCSEENRTDKLHKLLQIAKSQYHVEPEFLIQQVVLSGILRWNYQIQIYLAHNPEQQKSEEKNAAD